MYSGTDSPELRKLAGAAYLPFHILVIGPQASGKSGFAELLGKRLGVRVCETSDFLMDELAIASVQVHPGQTLEEMRVKIATKSDHMRRRLVALGDRLTAARPDYLLQGAISGCQGGAIVVGARRKIELEAWFKDSRHSDDLLIEIEGGAENDDVFELKGWSASGLSWDFCRWNGAKWNVPSRAEFGVVVESVAIHVNCAIANKPEWNTDTEALTQI